jgi:hypothetical protein
MTHRCLNAYHALGVIPSPVDECPESQWDHQGRAPAGPQWLGFFIPTQPPRTESYEVRNEGMNVR